MALSLSIDDLTDEVLAMRKDRDDRMESVKRIKSAYHTPFFRPAGNSEAIQYDPENHAYEWMTLVVPQIAYKNPRVRTESRRGGAGFGVSVVHRHLLNQWINRHRFADLSYEQAHDLQLSYCVSLTTLKDDWHYTLEDGSPARNPVAKRISPNMFLIDTYGTSRAEARIMGHDWVIDRDDLILRAEKDPEAWNLDAIRGLPEDYGGEDIKTRRKRADGPRRKEILCTDLWIKDLAVEDEALPEDGFHGTILTVAMGRDGKVAIIGKPRPCMCAEWGPYSICDVSYVPDEPLGLAPLLAHEGPNRDLNRVARKLLDSIMAHGKFAVTNDPKFAERYKEAEHLGILHLAGMDLRNSIVEIEKGGASDQMLMFHAFLRDMMQRNSSTPNTKLGMSEKGKTATADVMADTAADIRTGNIKQRFDEHCTRILQSVSYLYYHNPKARGTLSPSLLLDLGFPPEQVDQMPIDGIEYRGGDSEFYPGLSWDDLAIAIEPLSMGRTSEGLLQKRTQDMLLAASQIIPLAAQWPVGDWVGFANAVGDNLNIPDLAKLLGLTKLSQMQMQPMMAGGPGMAPGGPGGAGMPGNETGGEISAANRGAA